VAVDGAAACLMGGELVVVVVAAMWNDILKKKILNIVVQWGQKKRSGILNKI